MKAKLKDCIVGVILTTLLIGAVCLVVYGVYMTDKEDTRKIKADKQCYQELTQLIGHSSTDTAKWIEVTVLAEKKDLRGLDYCRSLELVKGVSQDPKPQNSNNKESEARESL